MSVRILGLEVNLLKNRPLLGATKTGFLGLGRRRLLQEAAGWRARMLLGGNTWRPTYVFCFLQGGQLLCRGTAGCRVECWEREVHVQALRPGR